MPDMVAYQVTDKESITFIARPNLIRYVMILLSFPTPMEIHYISIDGNPRMYFIVLWKNQSFRVNTISQRISMRMFSHITSCKYTYRGSIRPLSEWCIFANLLSLQNMRE